MLALANKHYGGIKMHAVPERKPRPEPVQIGKRRIEVKAPADMHRRGPRLALWHLPYNHMKLPTERPVML